MNTWNDVLGPEKQKKYFHDILAFLEAERKKGRIIYPAAPDIFNALKFTPYKNVKVVLIGQDPYHGPGQAHGLAFSVQPGITPPPSLINIFNELKTDLNIPPPTHGCLISWAKQGVLLLNTVLTVEAHKPQSHSNIGWQTFTDTVISSLNQHPHRIVFLLWGSYAQKKIGLIDAAKHSVLQTSHPSPLSVYRGFAGCQHFSKTNAILQQSGQEPIIWKL